ncbi:pilus assembly protein PilM [Pseudomonas sp. SG-MS2]|uniref:Pilus assembly protein PilM n=1 Tax=Pseudomonas putida TaxID=303 RepID=A0A7Y7Z8Q2_PSEPU|nr:MULTISPECIES: pilus assembly protein PilM [Pseudomonas]KAF1311377.1 pilus assembly protein PilM [Pseudomonas sp. SG-MS2]NWC80365.1 pilus assembly protein PilM [Pseudomonas putida]
MLGRIGKDAGSLLGVEIAVDSVRLVQLQRRKGRCERLAWEVERFEPAGAADWWQVPDRVVAALRSACRRSGSRQRRVAVALPASQVICKLCQLPADQPVAEMEAQLLADADRLFPFPLEDLVMDFQVLGASCGQAGARDVLVVACRQTLLQSLEAIFDDAGLLLEVVEVDSIALRRMMPQPGADGCALLRLEPGSATLHCWSQGVLPQRREAPLGRLAELFVDDLQVQDLLLAGSLQLEQGRLGDLIDRLEVPYRALPQVAGLACHDDNMALASALALGALR